MKNVSDMIESYLITVLERSKQGIIEIQRGELAARFQCVPSQINYVINTRFTVEKGYVVESKRGGGGFIRIRKIKLIRKQDILQAALDVMGDEINQSTAQNVIQRLMESKVIQTREARMLSAVIQRDVLSFDLPVRDQLRAKVLRAVILTLMYE